MLVKRDAHFGQRLANGRRVTVGELLLFAINDADGQRASQVERCEGCIPGGQGRLVDQRTVEIDPILFLALYIGAGE